MVVSMILLKSYISTYLAYMFSNGHSRAYGYLKGVVWMLKERCIDVGKALSEC